MEDILTKLSISLDGKNYNYKDVFDKRFEVNIETYVIFKDFKDRYFSLDNTQQKYYFFIKPLSIKINNSLSFKDIYSYEQIKDILKKNNMNNIYLKRPNNQYKTLNPSNIIEVINNNEYELEFSETNIQYNAFDKQAKPFLIRNVNTFTPLDVTKHFYDYFKYNNKDDDLNNTFVYEDSIERSLLLTNLNKLHSNLNLHLFKFTGPSSIGKSTSLLYFSRISINIFYFNLSYLSKKEKEKDYVSCYNTLLEEFNRIYLPNGELTKYANLLKSQEGNKPWNIILNIFKFLFKIGYIYIFIFDQFKKDNIDEEIFNKLLSEIKKEKSQIKFIICSSINDNDIKGEFFKTITDYKGNPKELNDKTQDYYFYFSFLFRPKHIKKDKYYLLFKLFDFKPKYKRIFLNIKNNDFQFELNKIDKRIEKNLLKFKSFSSIIKTEQINLFESLINVLEILNTDIEYPYLGFYYDITPLKYFYFEFNANSFKIDYLFEYIFIFIKQKLEVLENDNFFLRKNIQNNLLEQNIKSYYFKKSAINSIIKRNIIFENNFQEIVKINEIVCMDFIIKNKLEEAIQRIKFNDNSEIIDEENNDSNTNNLSMDCYEKKENNNIKKGNPSEDIYGNDKNNNKELIKNLNNKNNERKNENLKIDINENIKYPESKEEKNEDEKDNNSSVINNEDTESDDDNKQNKKVNMIYQNRFIKMDEIKNELLNKLLETNKYIDYSIPKDNLLNINDFRNNINSFNKIDNNIRILDNRYKNKSILIKQDKLNGKCIDMAMIWNDNDKNIFIGFQMKCFKEKTKGGNFSNISKMLIKNYYLDILHNSNNLLGIEINQWHYIMVLYYNHKEINNKKNKYGFCDYFVNRCKRCGIKYIFYNPEEKMFYNNNLLPIKEKYKLIDEDSNLDYYEKISMMQNYFLQPFPCEFLNKKHLRVEEIITKKIDDFNSFKTFLNKTIYKSNKKYNLSNFKQDIKFISTNIEKIKFLEKIETSGIESFIPKEKHIFCFEGFNDEPLIIYKKSNNENAEFFGLISKKYYKGILDFVADIKNKEYFYALKCSLNNK